MHDDGEGNGNMIIINMMVEMIIGIIVIQSLWRLLFYW
jgi:hypothetical protein